METQAIYEVENEEPPAPADAIEEELTAMTEARNAAHAAYLAQRAETLRAVQKIANHAGDVESEVMAAERQIKSLEALVAQLGEAVGTMLDETHDRLSSEARNQAQAAYRRYHDVMEKANGH